MSGVCVCDCRSRNWERRAAISWGVKPAVRRRSKPRGAGVVVEEAFRCCCCCWAADDKGVGAREVSSAAAASATSSEGVRGSPIEQWM